MNMSTCTKVLGGRGTIPVVTLQARMAELNLGPIKFKLMDPKEGLGWTQEHADTVEKEYRNFLVLAGSEPSEPTVPFGDVDKMWHYHILDTIKYADDCEMLFGHFLHHFPYLGMRGPDDNARLQIAGEQTQVQYERLFGKRMSGQATTCTKC